MKTLRIVSLATVAALFVASPAGAGARRVRPLSLKGCYDQMASVQMPKSAVQAYLPEGFTPGDGAASQNEVVHVYVDAVVCGEDQALEMTKTYVSVDPPAAMKGATTGDFFVMDMGASGVAAARLAKHLCLGSALQDADVAGTQAVAPSDVGVPAAGTSTIESASYSATISATGATALVDRRAVYRWFFENDDQVGYYDTLDTIDGLAMGAGEVAFTAPYRDLPVASPAFSMYRTLDFDFYPSPSCARASR